VIESYHRPKSIEEALEFLSTPGKKVFPIGGGTQISQIRDSDVSLVDLQDLGLDKITQSGNMMQIGATATLHSLIAEQELSRLLREPVYHETNINTRNKASLGGAVITGDGRSTLLTALLALDSRILWLPGKVEQTLGEFLLTRNSKRAGILIASLSIPTNVKLQFEKVSRSPNDKPIISIAIAEWSSGRVRIAVGGFGQAPILVMDAVDRGGIEDIVLNALTNSGDAWASAEYRQDTAVILCKRMLGV
jgi:putative selenate reductase FAD-binding subunit